MTASRTSATKPRGPGRPRGSTNKIRATVETVVGTWSIEEASRMLGIGTSTAYRLVNAGQFPVPVRQIGHIKKILKSDMARYLAGDIGEDAAAS